MVKYELIVAMNQDGIIGITDSSGNQRLPFQCREDMRHFRETTMGHILVMGRKTFDSLPKRRPLPGRITFVLTRTPNPVKNDDSVYFSRLDNLEEVLNPLIRSSPRRIFICGGEEIYRALLPRCERLHITHIQCPVELDKGESTSRFSYLETDFQEVSIGNCVFRTLDRVK